MFATNAQSNRTSPLDRQITTPENQASAEFESTNPLEQGLGGRFFGLSVCRRIENIVLSKWTMSREGG
jgi:hypothetical protein